MSESVDVQQLIQALALDGAHQFDPVGFHYIETLASRVGTHQGSVQRILEGKLGVAAQAFKTRLEQAHSEPTPTTPVPVEPAETLRGLVRRLAQDRSGQAADQTDSAIAQRPELKSVRNFRNTWSKLSVNKQVNQALTQAPKNAGPLNSHRVALRSLALMRDISPDYLNRFMSYVDTLLCLDQGDTGLLPSRAPSVEGSSGKKVKAIRGKNRP